MKRLLLFVLLMISCVRLMAQTDTTRYLLPIYLQRPIPGALGSLWTAELRILNTGSTAASIDNVVLPCAFNECPPISYAPGASTTFAPIVPFEDNGIPAALLIVRNDAQFSFQLRARDLSRDAQGWGTWVPVIRESQARPDAVHLTNIPTDSRYRQLLRVYSFQQSTGLAVRVRVYGANSNPNSAPTQSDQFLGETVLPLRVGTFSQPAYAQFDGIAAFAGATTYETLRVVVEPLGSFSLWAMVSITNNVTQQATIVIPNP